MNIDSAMNRYCRGLSRTASDALQDGLDEADVFQGLLGTIAVSVRRAGGDEGRSVGPPPWRALFGQGPHRHQRGAHDARLENLRALGAGGRRALRRAPQSGRNAVSLPARGPNSPSPTIESRRAGSDSPYLVARALSDHELGRLFFVFFICSRCHHRRFRINVIRRSGRL